MATNTTNYSLVKPATGEAADISVINSNMDPIDTTLKSISNPASGKQDTVSAGTGISLNGATINHSNSVTAQTSYLGGSTSALQIKYDAQGHITGATTTTIYPPTYAGANNQYWKSDGSGQGVWTTPSSSPSSGSSVLISSGAVYTALANKQAVNLVFTSKTASSWTADTTYSDFGYRCAVACTGVTASDIAEVIFDVADATSGNYAPVCQTYAGGVYVYSSATDSVTIPVILVHKG